MKNITSKPDNLADFYDGILVGINITKKVMDAYRKGDIGADALVSTIADEIDAALAARLHAMEEK